MEGSAQVPIELTFEVFYIFQEF